MKTYVEATTTFTAYCHICDWYYEDTSFTSAEIERQQHEQIDH